MPLDFKKSPPLKLLKTSENTASLKFYLIDTIVLGGGRMHSELHIEKFCKCKSIDLNQIPSFCAHTYNLKILLTCRSPTQNRIINSISNQRKYFVVATKLEFVMQINLADQIDQITGQLHTFLWDIGDPVF